MITEKSRISFSQYDAEHLYDLALEHFCVYEKEGKCVLCLRLKKRLELFIGKKEATHIQKQVRKYSHCKNLLNDDIVKEKDILRWSREAKSMKRKDRLPRVTSFVRAL